MYEAVIAIVIVCTSITCCMEMLVSHHKQLTDERRLLVLRQRRYEQLAKLYEQQKLAAHKKEATLGVGNHAT